ncbi:MAG TPA: nicotinate-nucleotide adenylyltransferase [Vicinamibacterales bacterium]|nr:nicotinate-nucleotide adenylyltransferase [Vicinamibacterales bacterium]
MMPRPRVGLLGGTFDPIHHGHLAAARAAQHTLGLDQVRFIPSARPPHRPDSPQASEYHRVEMIRRAIEDGAGWEVSDLELRRHGPSYTYDTLTTLNGDGLSPSQIFFITGSDAFAEIASWHRYPDVLDLAHFVVVGRPGFSIEALRRRVPALANRMIEPADLAVSSTPQVILVEAETPDVSSTAIRERAARRESLEGLVPPAVSAYISQHGIYSSGH